MIHISRYFHLVLCSSCLIGLLMQQNAYMVTAFVASVLLCISSAVLDFKRDTSLESLNVQVKDLAQKVDGLSSTVGLKSMALSRKGP